MKRSLFPKEGKFYKANLHCHTMFSDGKLTPEEIKKLYQENGYSVVAYTDHGLLIPHNDLTDVSFVALNGMEVEMNEQTFKHLYPHEKCIHMCFIAKDENNHTHPLWHRSEYLFCNEQYRHLVKFDQTKPDYIREYSGKGVREMIKIGKEAGFFVTYNHPKWNMENYGEYSQYEGMDALEIYNHGAYMNGFNDYSPDVYDDLLRQGKHLYCIATDDNHNDYPVGHQKYDSFGGFTMIKAKKLTYESIISAMEKGNMYASRGPIIHDIWVDTQTKTVHVSCSDAKQILFITGVRYGSRVTAKAQGKEYLNSAEFAFQSIYKYVRITITDEEGNTADTRAFFSDEILK